MLSDHKHNICIGFNHMYKEFTNHSHSMDVFINNTWHWPKIISVFEFYDWYKNNNLLVIQNDNITNKQLCGKHIRCLINQHIKIWTLFYSAALSATLQHCYHLSLMRSFPLPSIFIQYCVQTFNHLHNCWKIFVWNWSPSQCHWMESKSESNRNKEKTMMFVKLVVEHI